MKQKKHESIVEAGERSYREWRDGLQRDPKYKAIYEEEAARSELWLQLFDMRKSMGLTQAQMAARLGVSRGHVSRIENFGYIYTIKTLRRYIQMLEAAIQDNSLTPD